MGTKTFDTKCLDLAGSSLSDEDWYQRISDPDERLRYANALANKIQETIENELQYYRESLLWIL